MHNMHNEFLNHTHVCVPGRCSWELRKSEKRKCNTFVVPRREGEGDYVTRDTRLKEHRFRSKRIDGCGSLKKWYFETFWNSGNSKFFKYFKNKINNKQNLL